MNRFSMNRCCDLDRGEKSPFWLVYSHFISIVYINSQSCELFRTEGAEAFFVCLREPLAIALQLISFSLGGGPFLLQNPVFLHVFQKGSKFLIWANIGQKWVKIGPTQAQHEPKIGSHGANIASNGANIPSYGAKIASYGAKKCPISAKKTFNMAKHPPTYVNPLHLVRAVFVAKRP